MMTVVRSKPVEALISRAIGVNNAGAPFAVAATESDDVSPTSAR
jgi:hypothetical protein